MASEDSEFMHDISREANHDRPRNESDIDEDFVCSNTDYCLLRFLLYRRIFPNEPEHRH